MSYRAGLFGNTNPTIFCDGPGCGARREIDGLPPQWFMNNKAAPGWSLDRTEHDDGVTRIDLCPKHCTPARERGGPSMSPGTPRVAAHDERCAVFEAAPDGGPSLKPCDCRDLGLAPRCTGVSASWCPVCGDCKCPDREQDLDDPRCPLHGSASDHASLGASR